MLVGDAARPGGPSSPSWSELARRRTSRRRFVAEPLDDRTRAAVEALAAAAPAGPFGGRPRLVLVASTPDDPRALRKLGTYGFIRGAPAFVVGVLRRDGDPGAADLEDFGYAMEWFVLRATGLDLGTCWMGGTFRRSRFAAAADLADDEAIPAVIAVGRPTDRHGLVESLVRRSARAHTRRPPEALFFDREPGRPLDPATAGPLALALELVRGAPSASNKQPWRLLRDAAGRWHLLLSRTPGYAETNARLGILDLQRVDMGIAMLHFEVAAREVGAPGRWLPPDPPPLPEGLEPVATWDPAAGAPAAG